MALNQFDHRSRILPYIDREPPSLETQVRAPVRIGDHALNEAEKGWVEPSERKQFRAAAVLVPIVEHQDGAHVLLTRRADHLGQHSGQVAFPGGKVDGGETATEAALREAEEEVGLDRSHVEIAGYLDVYETGTGFRILPVVGFVVPGFQLTVSEAEVAEVFEVPLSFLLDGHNHERHNVMWQGKRRHYYAMPYKSHYIWGATAGMIRNLYERVERERVVAARPVERANEG